MRWVPAGECHLRSHLPGDLSVMDIDRSLTDDNRDCFCYDRSVCVAEGDAVEVLERRRPQVSPSSQVDVSTAAQAHGAGAQPGGAGGPCRGHLPPVPHANLVVLPREMSTG